MSRRLQLNWLPGRPHADRTWAIGILLSGLSLGILAFWIGSANQQAAEAALEVSPESIYSGEFTLWTREGFVSFAVDDIPLLTDFFTSLARGEPASRIATRDFALKLSGSVYSRGGEEISFACVANNRGGPWFAVVESVHEIRVMEDRAIERIVSRASSALDGHEKIVRMMPQDQQRSVNVRWSRQ